MSTASIPAAGGRPRPEGVFTRAIVEELIRRSPFVSDIREQLETLEAKGIIVVVDEMPPAAVGSVPRGVA